MPNSLAGPNQPLAEAWSAWKAAFLSPEGRVIDKLQQGASHSESQGYGLLMAALFHDNATFDAIYRWTEANLAIRSDALLAWRWLPNQTVSVADRNNATDGDLFYAWALVLHSRATGMLSLRRRATAIAESLVKNCVVEARDGSGRLLLTPAAEGFARKNAQIINPSYYMPRAMREIAAATGINALATCASDGEALMTDLATQGLMPDWIEVGTSGMTPAVNMSDKNGYEAMRVALFLIWSGNAAHLAVADQVRAYLQAETSGNLQNGEYVTVMDRKSGAVLEASSSLGYGALAAFSECASHSRFGAKIPFFRTDEQPYYPATLHLMTLIAQIVSAPECVPI
ncbi:glycosyl hydrolase family 8 [Thioclava sp. ES.031]|uniref:glycosyl hydrolase family 8 n=1 Tax=Thioclava sp. ES.031 TaxID=1798203 RepID=UPI000BF4F285|nr:glycosyl hydrolase family 8 [Thioclava sp. ES.031]